ncbi:hypothetical protein [Liquorilactobacillus hordei]|uniref:hypothetical protein n=1 Tax=Liquorilactobacillus hordei TaxID=468911 RepID=UPI00070CB72F|nr:hypothetical protein [Liquorilactobacillus hordei]QYH51109.1 hypothetical protein G6O70_00690 [Liquorilactobacillus hordei DSM 19519]
MISAKKQAEIINERINKYFIPNIRARYQINVTNNIYDKVYGFYFLRGKPNHFTRSTPIRSLKNEEYNIEYLESIIRELEKLTNFTIRYIAFENLRWHSNDKLIQR